MNQQTEHCDKSTTIPILLMVVSNRHKEAGFAVWGGGIVFPFTNSFFGHDGAHPGTGRLPQDAGFHVHFHSAVLVPVPLINGGSVLSTTMKSSCEMSEVAGSSSSSSGSRSPVQCVDMQKKRQGIPEACWYILLLNSKRNPGLV